MALSQPDRSPIGRSKRLQRVTTIAVSVLILAALILLLAFGTETIRRFRSSEALWVEYSQDSQAINRSTANLMASIGYGGLIHNFKNYVLRRDPVYLEWLRRNIADYEREMSNLEHLLQSNEERQALKVIRSTFDEYIINMEKAVEMAPGLSPVDVDKVVKVNDEPAKAAFRLILSKSEERLAQQRKSADMASERAISFMQLGSVVAVVLVAAGALILFLIERLTLANRALQRAFKRIDLLIDNAPDPTLCVNKAGQIIRCNSSAEAFFGYHRGELEGMTVEDLLPERFRKTHKKKREGFYNGELGVRPMGTGQDFYALTKDKGERTVDINISFVDEETEQIAIVGIRDVTESRQMQNLLIKTKEAAEAGSQAKSQFLATMSHELRSPLNVILGYSELIQMGAIDDKIRDYVANVITAGEHLLALIGDIMDYSKIEAGSLELEMVPFDLSETLKDVVTAHQLSANTNNNKLYFEAPEGFSDWVVGDPTRIKQVVVNYLSNALKFTNDGDVTVTLTALDEQADTGRFRISVSDTGIGIPADKLNTVFDRFSQADSSTSRKFGGTGLGLAICKSLVEAMDGTVGVVSEPRKGSEFWFEVLLPKMQPIEAGPVDEPHSPDERLSVLLVEDVDLNRRMAKLLLERMGHQVTVAQNGVEAVKAVAEQPYDVVLMDIHMPELDGIEATKEIRRLSCDHAAQIPIFALTADVAHHHIEKYLDAGMAGYISKPINFNSLRKRLQSIER